MTSKIINVSRSSDQSAFVHRRAMSFGAEIGDNYVREIYAWLDEIPLSRPKRNVARDFSDGGKFFYIRIIFIDWLVVYRNDKHLRIDNLLLFLKL